MPSARSTIPGATLPPDFQISLGSVAGTITVAIEGELDLATAPLLTAALRQARTSAAREVILDLHGLSFIDVSGVRAILQAEAQMLPEGPQLRVIRCPAPARRVFELCREIDPALCPGGAEL
jgi:anti-anti-sigma factor